MLAEGRCRGDWMQWDYSLASPDVERVFELTMQCFHARNFGDGALNNRIMATRFDIEVCRHFHSDIFRPAWLEIGKELTRELSLDTVQALARIVEHVKSRPTDEDAALVSEIEPRLRDMEKKIAGGARELAAEVATRVGRGLPLTDLGDRVATPLQTARLPIGALA
jgi:hypothetical protein